MNIATGTIIFATVVVALVVVGLVLLVRAVTRPTMRGANPNHDSLTEAEKSVIRDL